MPSAQYIKPVEKARLTRKGAKEIGKYIIATRAPVSPKIEM